MYLFVHLKLTRLRSIPTYVRALLRQVFYLYTSISYISLSFGGHLPAKHPPHTPHTPCTHTLHTHVHTISGKIERYDFYYLTNQRSGRGLRYYD